jgi:peptidoglycan/LPS O-acetylase OafA/YrhL
MVFVFHYGGGLRSSHAIVRLLGYATEAGWTGVILFFALSGFLITGSLWDSRGAQHLLRNFYARRTLRIFPLYYAALAAALLAALARGAAFRDLHPLAIYAFFLQDFPVLAKRAVDFPSLLPLYHFWSLAVEEQFYLLWPALLLLARSRRAAFALSLGVFGLSWIFRLIIWGSPPPGIVDSRLFESFLLTHAGALALGAALAIAMRSTRHKKIERWALAAFIAGTLLYFLTSWYSGSFYLTPRSQFTLGLTGVSLAATALIPLVMREGLPRALCSVAPMRWLGRISYGFYVFHILLQPIFDAIAVHATHTTAGMAYQTARFVASFPITLLVSALSFYFFEQPILSLKRRFPMRNPLPPA